jgi:leukotriene-A4 hydrolase
MKKIILLSALAILIISCNKKNIKMDHHSFSGLSDARVTNLYLDIFVNFENQEITGTAHYDIHTNGSEKIYFDTKNLEIFSVQLDGENAEFSFEKDDEILGKALAINIHEDTKKVSIAFQTTQGALALQWLPKEQTMGKKFPFLFTQGQAVLSRTWFPCQDSPAVRFTYEAHVKVPRGMMALMSAENPQEVIETGIYYFKMKQAIPAYLVALAVGEFSFIPTGNQTGVYAEPQLIDKAAYEFAEMEQMLFAAEKLYGKYLWERYDVLVLPPSFPFGGMENPRLTFATPTIIAGDRSLTSLVAHELAHSWSGNLVTNATWDDFWLNEGFTVYFERRIMESLYGKEYADMLEVLGYQDLVATVEEIGVKSKDTQLKLNLKGRDADDGMNDVAYEKGYFFLKMIEEKIGREKFDAFLKAYFDHFKFQSIVTEDFVAYLNKKIIEPENVKLNLTEWIYKPGIPESLKTPISKRFEECGNHAKEFINNGIVPDSSITNKWTTHEWLHFIRMIPNDVNNSYLIQLDAVYQLFETQNNEIKFEWLERCIANKHKEAIPFANKFLNEVGRRKFVLPLFKRLIENGFRTEAENIYKTARSTYHSVTANSVDAVLKINVQK